MNIDSNLCKEVVNEANTCFKSEFNTEITGSDLDGQCAILITPKGVIISSDRGLLKDDINTISNYIIDNEFSNITDKLQYIKLSMSVFIFKKFKAKTGGNYVLAGCFLHQSNNILIMSTVLRARKMCNV